MRVAIYGRVSTEEQALEGFSIAAQKEKLAAFALSQDWHVVDYYIDEGVSAKNTARPELRRLLADVRQRKLDVVLVYRLDRLTRSVLDLYQLLQEFAAYDVRFKSATEVYDTTTAIGRLFITLVAALAQWERENLAERVKLGMEQMALEEKRPGGPPPYGYRLENGSLQPDEAEAAVVRQIFSRYLSGAGMATIAEELNSQGIVPRNKGVWSPSTIARMLKNHAYYGTLRWNYAERGSQVNSPEKWVLQENVHTPLISKETFLRAEHINAARKAKHPRELASDFIFSGVLHCSLCGSPMYGKTGRTTKRDKTYLSRYYMCKGKQAKSCSAPLVREDRLAEAFLLLLQRELADDRDASEAAEQHVKAQRDHAKSFERELAKVAARQKRRQLAYLEGAIGLEEFSAGRLQDRLVEAQLQWNLSQQDVDVNSAVEQLAALLSNIPLAWTCATARERKQLVSLLVDRLEAASENRRAMITRCDFL